MSQLNTVSSLSPPPPSCYLSLHLSPSHPVSISPLPFRSFSFIVFLVTAYLYSIPARPFRFISPTPPLPCFLSLDPLSLFRPSLTPQLLFFLFHTFAGYPVLIPSWLARVSSRTFSLLRYFFSSHPAPLESPRLSRFRSRSFSRSPSLVCARSLSLSHSLSLASSPFSACVYVSFLSFFLSPSSHPCLTHSCVIFNPHARACALFLSLFLSRVLVRNVSHAFFSRIIHSLYVTLALSL